MVAWLGLTSLASWASGRQARAGWYGERYEIRPAARRSRQRLAAATAAQGLLAGDRRLLLRAARLCPENPAYWRFAASEFLMPMWEIATVWALPSRDQVIPRYPVPEQHRLLGYALRADPTYLPARCAYALTRPTPKQRLSSLAALAVVERNNALPCYLAALDEYQRAVGMSPRPVDGAFREQRPLGPAEARAVARWLAAGNARPVLRGSIPAPPSSRDLRVFLRGHLLPQAAVESLLVTGVHTGLGAEGMGAGIAAPSRGRRMVQGLVRVACEAHEQGRGEEALAFLRAARGFGEQYARSEPRLGVSFYMGRAIRSPAAKAELAVLIALGREQEVLELSTRNQAWDTAAQRTWDVDGLAFPSVPITPGHPLECIDYVGEARSVKALLRGLPE